MITVLLWIAMILAILLIAVLAAPIRFGINAEYRKNGPFVCDFWCSYVHPAIFRYVWLPENDGEQIWIFGMKRRKKDEDMGIDDDTDSNNGIDIDKDAGNDEASDDNNRKEVSQKPPSQTSEAAPRLETPPLSVDKDTAAENTVRPKIKSGGKKKASYISRIRTFIRTHVKNIRSHYSYKIIRDKPLRNKLIRWLWRLPARLLAPLTLKKLRLHAIAGFHDPAATGKLYGYFSAARSAVIRRGGVIDVSLEPVFMENRLEIDADITAKTTAAALLWWWVGVLLFTFPVYRVYRIFREKNRP
ncbi:MAG: DUF2953 domain-containing protein [Chitinispirillales bacterium]|jgi:hypothetical protein|nr:DUF2953 domain-containing protein [Chitinispirillales bacterium]